MILTTTARNAMVDALAALLDGGTIEFQTSAGTVLATLDFDSTAFAAAASGTATANAIVSGTAIVGTAAKAIFKNSGGTQILQASVTVTGGGGDLTAAAVVFTLGEVITISSLTLTQPAGT